MANTFYTEIVELNGSVFKGDVISIAAPGMDGGFQILANHAPMLAAMGVGVISIKTPEGDKIDYTTGGGFVQVHHNKVMVLAESAEAVSEIDAARAQSSMDKALAQLAKAEDPVEKEKARVALERARNRLRASMGKV
ncbi:MAG: ATP synthase F1 subunit epsilon [Bacteroidetes Order II. Incertae sedis bacterium]|nr:ATP synthase F1 subunit epsilon [Bacteroidetes Order II. bacterium]